MSAQPTQILDSVVRCCDDIINTVGNEIVIGLPIGVGKPTHIVNELYRRAKQNPDIKLNICTGLTLHTPIPNSDFERRLIEPLVARLFPGYPDPVYFSDAKKRAMPPNVTLKEIYFSPGYALNNLPLQENYISANFTYVTRAMAAQGCNVTAVQLSPKAAGPQGGYSLGGNADAAIMMINDLLESRKAGRKVYIVGQINSYMPYTYGASEVAPEIFNSIVDAPELYHPLFAAPKEPVSSTEYSIAFHVSALIKDGGTFQVGFGSLGDAIIYCLLLRQNGNGTFKRVLTETKILSKFSDIIEYEGGMGRFEKGLYGCSEFIFDGFLDMMDNGIVKRKVYDHPAIQKLVVEEKLSEEISPKTIDLLLEEKVISSKITEPEFLLLREYGIFKDTVRYESGVIHYEGGRSVQADLDDRAGREAILANCLGSRLKKGVLVHAGFFVGSRKFYQDLHEMEEARLREIQMREISFVNDLIADTNLKIMQRRHGRFVNTAMMVSLLGGVTSDTLDSGQVVSGVGGQYNFVSMAHHLPGARSIIMIRSFRENAGGITSNIVWNSCNLTIPRHMRDIFVTEYGIADTRDKTDRDTIAALLNIADSRLQPELLKKAKAAGKIAQNYEIPPAFRNNYPEALEALAAPFKKEGYFPVFPFGSDFTKEELVLAKALRGLKKKMTVSGFRPPSVGELKKIISPPSAAKPYLERMQLDKPATPKEKVMRKLVLFALASDGVI